MTDLDALRSMVSAGDLERVAPDLNLAKRLHSSAVSDLKWARRKVADPEAQDLLGAVSDAWEAVVKLSSSALAVVGLRLKSERGHHIAALDALAYLVATKDVSSVRRAGRLRVPRSQAFYQAELNLSETDILSYLGECESVAAVVAEVVARAEQSGRTDSFA